MSTPNDGDDRWLEVLAGRCKSDTSNRSAAQLRHYFQQQQRIAQEQARLALDDAAAQRRHERLLAALREQGLLGKHRVHGGSDAHASKHNAAFASQPPGTRPSSGLRNVLARWLSLFKPMTTTSPRWATAVALGLALVVAVPLLMHGTGGGEESILKTSPLVAEPAAAEVLMMVANPADEATRIAASLAGMGLTVNVCASGDSHVVLTQVPPEAHDAVQTALMADGVVVPPHGKLRLRLRPLP